MVRLMNAATLRTTFHNSIVHNATMRATATLMGFNIGV
jgi:hypothetical protein